jgi:hypothetical protein
VVSVYAEYRMGDTKVVLLLSVELVGGQLVVSNDMNISARSLQWVEDVLEVTGLRMKHARAEDMSRMGWVSYTSVLQPPEEVVEVLYRCPSVVSLTLPHLSVRTVRSFMDRVRRMRVSLPHLTMLASAQDEALEKWDQDHKHYLVYHLLRGEVWRVIRRIQLVGAEQLLEELLDADVGVVYEWEAS